MAFALAKREMTEDEYFEMLEKSIDKYEYWNGVAVAMAGAQPDHVSIEINITGELFQQLRGRDCCLRNSNQAVKLNGNKGYVFPDITIVCGKPEYVIKRGIGCLLNPSAVMEVLSPSTATIDESEKLRAYSAMRTVREYLIIQSERYAVKLYSRQTPEELWTVRLYESLDDAVSLESCGCRLTLAEIYAGVDLAGKNLF
jgi:Uma2 family endonuclease